MSLNYRHEVSVIIPVYNEVDNVADLYYEIVQALPVITFRYEVIFVDDGSTDGTGERLRLLAEDEERLIVVRHVANFGQSAALVSGARAAQYRMLVTLDGDGQNDPNDIPLLFSELTDKPCVILGNRKQRHDGILKKISSWVGNTVRRMLLKDECKDTGCSLKLFPRDAFLALPHFNHLHRFLPALFKRAGYQLINVPVNHRSRWHGHSKYGVMNRLFVGVYDLIGVQWLLRRPCAPEVINDAS